MPASSVNATLFLDFSLLLMMLIIHAIGILNLSIDILADTIPSVRQGPRTEVVKAHAFKATSRAQN